MESAPHPCHAPSAETARRPLQTRTARRRRLGGAARGTRTHKHAQGERETPTGPGFASGPTAWLCDLPRSCRVSLRRDTDDGEGAIPVRYVLQPGRTYACIKIMKRGEHRLPCLPSGLAGPAGGCTRSPRGTEWPQLLAPSTRSEAPPARERPPQSIVRLSCSASNHSGERPPSLIPPGLLKELPNVSTISQIKSRAEQASPR